MQHLREGVAGVAGCGDRTLRLAESQGQAWGAACRVSHADTTEEHGAGMAISSMSYTSITPVSLPSTGIHQTALQS